MKIIKIKKGIIIIIIIIIIIVIHFNPAFSWDVCPHQIGKAAWLYPISKIVHLNMLVLTSLLITTGQLLCLLYSCSFGEFLFITCWSC